MEWDYSILDRSGYSIARVSKELFHMTDTYVIDVQDPGNALDALDVCTGNRCRKMFQKLIVDLVTVIIRRMKYGIIQKRKS